MAEYIEKGALMSLIESEAHRWGDDYDWWQCLADVEDFKPADVRHVVRGRWIVRETAYEDTEARCSECGFTTLINEPGNGLHMLSDLNYCPGCGSYNGADMTGGDAE